MKRTCRLHSLLPVDHTTNLWIAVYRKAEVSLLSLLLVSMVKSDLLCDPWMKQFCANLQFSQVCTGTLI